MTKTGLAIYSATGICVWQGHSSNAHISAPEAGIYIIDIDGETMKLMVH